MCCIAAVERFLADPSLGTGDPLAHVFTCLATTTLPARYERALRQNNALDFDDLLGQTVALLRSAPAVRERYVRRFRCGAWMGAGFGGWKWCKLQRGRGEPVGREPCGAGPVITALALLALMCPLLCCFCSFGHAGTCVWTSSRTPTPHSTSWSSC